MDASSKYIDKFSVEREVLKSGSITKIIISPLIDVSRHIFLHVFIA